MLSAAAATALTVTLLLLLEAPGGALAHDAGVGRGPRGNNDTDNVLKKSKPTAADLDRSILLEWRASSPRLQQVWSDENAPVSAWEGVTVGAAGRVVKIEIESKDLTGVPAALGRLSALTRLSLGGNQLTSVPAELGNLAKLKTLLLAHNRLTSVPASLGNLAALEVLDLLVNELTSVPKELGNLAKLTKWVDPPTCGWCGRATGCCGNGAPVQVETS